MNFDDIRHYRGNMVGKDYPSFLASHQELVTSGGAFFPVSNRQALLEAQGAEVKEYYGKLGSEMGASISTGLSSTIGGALEGLSGGLLSGKTDSLARAEGDTTPPGGFQLPSGLGFIAIVLGGVYLLGKWLSRGKR